MLPYAVSGIFPSLLPQAGWSLVRFVLAVVFFRSFFSRFSGHHPCKLPERRYRLRVASGLFTVNFKRDGVIHRMIRSKSFSAPRRSMPRRARGTMYTVMNPPIKSNRSVHVRDWIYRIFLTSKYVSKPELFQQKMTTTYRVSQKVSQSPPSLNLLRI